MALNRFQNLPSKLYSSFLREKPVWKRSNDVSTEKSEVNDDRQQDEQPEPVAPIQIFARSGGEEGVEGEEEVDVVQNRDEAVKTFHFKWMILCSQTTQLSLKGGPVLADVAESGEDAGAAHRLIGVGFRQIFEQIVPIQDDNDGLVCKRFWLKKNYLVSTTCFIDGLYYFLHWQNKQIYFEFQSLFSLLIVSKGVNWKSVNTI